VFVNELFEASLRFPTVVFTIALGITLIYWVFVLLGALDIDLLGGGDVSGAAKGIGDAMVGGAKGGAEALHGHGGGDGVDHDGGLLGLSNVPITISISFVVLSGWCLSLLGSHYGGKVLGSSALIGLVVLALAFVVALLVAAVLVRPLAPVFKIREGKSNKDYVGHVCTVTTGHVDDGFGQATIEDGPDVLVIPVRCDRTGALARGSKALVVDFDAARNAYIVEPAGELVDLPPS